jgi:hypothetical protein
LIIKVKKQQNYYVRVDNYFLRTTLNTFHSLCIWINFLVIPIFAGELDFEPALLRLQAFSKLLVDKFMPESPKQRALLAQPWKLIKKRAYANGEFELLQLLALDADYGFGAGKNLENVNKFVANVCAIIRQYVVHDWSDGKHMRFHVEFFYILYLFLNEFF